MSDIFDEAFNDILEDICEEDRSEIVNHVVFIMDHSGSMYGNRGNMALSNFNEQIQELKSQADKHGQRTMVTLVEFSGEHNIKFMEKPIGKVNEVKEYNCNGSTALNDTLAYMIGKMKNDVPELGVKELNHSVLFIIMTDGEENISKEFGGIKGRNKLKQIIEEMEKEDNWTFTFMGANLDVQKDIVGGMAFSAGNTMSFTSDVEGFKMSNVGTTSGIKNYYTSRSKGVKKVGDFYSLSTGDAATGKTPNDVSAVWDQYKETSDGN